MKQKFNLGRAVAVAKKEVFHVLRDPFTLALAVVLPVLMVTVFGLTIDFNPRDIRLTVFDADRSQASRALVETFQSSGYFKVKYGRRGESLVRDLDRERSRAVLVIEPGFQRKIGSHLNASAQVILDGADNSTVGVIIGYLSGIQRAATSKIAKGISSASSERGIGLRTRFLFNSELRSDWFVVPGLAVVVIAILSVLLTSLTIAREWENGSMELLLSTPVQPFEIIVGKLAPYTLLGVGAVIFVYLVARLGFEVPFRGSHLLFFFSSGVFLATSLAQGLLISVALRKQQIAMQVAMITGLLPSILLSGFIFPIESMPLPFRILTSILPAKWFMIISRDVFLKGAGVISLALPLGALLALNIVFVTLATRHFKKDLEP